VNAAATDASGSIIIRTFSIPVETFR